MICVFEVFSWDKINICCDSNHLQTVEITFGTHILQISLMVELKISEKSICFYFEVVQFQYILYLRLSYLFKIILTFSCSTLFYLLGRLPFTSRISDENCHWIKFVHAFAIFSIKFLIFEVNATAEGITMNGFRNIIQYVIFKRDEINTCHILFSETKIGENIWILNKSRLPVYESLEEVIAVHWDIWDTIERLARRTLEVSEEFHQLI